MNDEINEINKTTWNFWLLWSQIKPKDSLFCCDYAEVISKKYIIIILSICHELTGLCPKWPTFCHFYNTNYLPFFSGNKTLCMKYCRWRYSLFVWYLFWPCKSAFICEHQQYVFSVHNLHIVFIIIHPLNVTNIHC